MSTLPKFSKKRQRPESTYTGTESSFQKSAIVLVRAIAKCDPRLVAHIPNGGQRTAIAGAKLKAEGVVKGYPDIMVFVEGYRGGRDESDKWLDEVRGDMARGLAIELKVWPNKLKPEQQEVHDLLQSQGWRVEVCYGLDDVTRVAKEYFGACGKL
jgi:hypothetical protein